MNMHDGAQRMPPLCWTSQGSGKTVTEAKQTVMVALAGFLAEEGVTEIAVEQLATASRSAPRSTMFLARNTDLPGVLMTLSSGSTLRFRLMSDQAFTLRLCADGFEALPS